MSDLTKMLKALPEYLTFDDANCVLCYCLDNNVYYIIMGLPNEEIWEKCAEQIYLLENPKQYIRKFKALERSVHLYAGSGEIVDNVLYTVGISRGPFISHYTKFANMNILIFDEHGNKIGKTKQRSELELDEIVFKYYGKPIGREWLNAFIYAVKDTRDTFEKDMRDTEDDICSEQYDMSKKDMNDMKHILTLLDNHEYTKAIDYSKGIDTSPRECLWMGVPDGLSYKYDMQW